MNVYLEVFAQNTTRVELRGFGRYTAVDTFVYVNTATVVCTMFDNNDVQLSGVTWPVTLSYESGSDGNYSGLVPETLAVSVGDIISAEITATESGNQGKWVVPVEVVNRSHRRGYG